MERQSDIESLFRRESPRLITVLTRILGAHNLELAEDVLQEAFIAALDDWSDGGIPDNAPAWLLTTARNRAIDAIRRERTRRTFAPDLAIYLDSEWTLARTVDETFADEWIRDDQLKMIFMCCRPKLTPVNRLTLILKTLCGLSVPAIARALLTTEAAVNKRLYRTRRALDGGDFGLPPEDELPEALETVHTVLYLLFNEGYHSTGEDPIVRELCRDAMSLTKLLADEPSVASSGTVALLALMCFNAARLDSRADDDGRLVPLDEQDRSLWDRDLIGQGFALLRRSSGMGTVRAGRYHLEAAIAARHCQAETFDATDWPSICHLYDRLLDVAPSPTTRLNRAVAISYRSGPREAIPLVEELRAEDALPHSPVVAAALANLYGRAGRPDRAAEFLEEALDRTETPHERRFIERQAGRAMNVDGETAAGG
ncbi:MAG: RNA polymerase sigma factor [Gemmatimonadota bacterium]